MSMRLTSGLAMLAAVVMLSFAAAGALAAAPPATDQAKGRADETQQRPNILFVFTDDHGYQVTGPDAYPSRFDQLNPTPTIDRLARQGMVFENCFVTNSICGPSRAVIQTGKYSHLNGFFNNGQRFNNRQQTFPKLLQEAGYQTAIMGKWHLKSTPTGFDYYEVLDGQGHYYNPKLLTPEGPRTYTGYTTDIITDQALGWLKHQRNKDEPFMLMYQHKAPHRNWRPGPKHLHTYDDTRIPQPETMFDDYANRASPAREQHMEIAEIMNKRDLKLTGAPDRMTDAQAAKWNAAYGPKNKRFRQANLQGRALERWKYQRYAKDYLRCMKSVDENLDRVLKYLDKSGLAKNTIVVYTSDQGMFVGEHGWFDKRWMYEISLRTPLIVRWPGQVKPGSRNQAMVSNLDFAETLLDVADAPVPDDMQGRSLVPLMKGETPSDWRDSFYYHFYELPGPHHVARHYGVRTDRYKLINYYRQNEWELFDLKKDPNELNSVYGEPAYQDVQQRLKQQMKRLQLKYKEPHPENSLQRYRRRQAKKQLQNTQTKQIFALDSPDGEAPDRPDIAKKTFTVGARAVPTAGDGVLISQGGQRHGYALYLKNGVPHFSMYANGRMTVVKADEPVAKNKPVHLAGALNSSSEMVLYVNGEAVARKAAMPIPQTPAFPLAVGRDSLDPSGDFKAPMPFKGELSDIRLYHGALDGETLKQWVSQ